MSNTHIPTLTEAKELHFKYNDSDSLRKHGLAVSGAMRYFAKLAGEDEDMWAIVGLVHDLDYEKYPDQHCVKSEEILREAGWPDEYIRAVLSHAWGICTDVEPRSKLEKTLYAIDELVGFITACVLVRPSKSVLDIEAKSVKKKWKDKRFAASVDRDVVEKGTEMLGMDFTDMVTKTIAGMREVAEEIGLK